MARTKLQGFVPAVGESVEDYIARGKMLDAQALLEFRPQEGDSLGEYLLRLRVANDLTPEQVESYLNRFPENAALTRAELARLESGALEIVNELRLQILATLYGIPQSWVLQVAQYHVERYTPPLPATDNTFAVLNTRALHVNSHDPTAQQTLKDIFDEIIAAVQETGSNPPPEA